MKAAQLIHYGSEDSIEIKTVDMPAPDSDEVLVEVHAAAVNPLDIKVREGLAQTMAELQLPATLGGDVAGVVSAVGESASNLNVGDEVYGQANALGGQGSFAEYTPVKAGQLAAKPKNIDFVEAASLPLVTCSAYQTLVDHMNLQAGQKILIHGGAGGIGSMAIQIAKHLGAYVATTASAADTGFVKSLGADEVIDYKNQDFSKVIKNYNAVYDTIGGETNRKSYGVLRPGGTLVSMVEQPNDNLVQEHDIEYISQFTHVTTERLSRITELVDKGFLKPNVDKVYPLDQAAEALEYLKTQHARGKVVIKVR